MRITKEKKSTLIFYLILSAKYLRKCVASNVKNCMWILELKVFTGHLFYSGWLPESQSIKLSETH